MLKIFDEESGQLELWMDLYPQDPFELPEELAIMAQILESFNRLSTNTGKPLKTANWLPPVVIPLPCAPLWASCFCIKTMGLAIAAPWSESPTVLAGEHFVVFH